MADHPLRPATRLSLGEPLPHQQADGPQAHPQAVASMERPPFTTASVKAVVLRGISVPFGTLSPARGQITYVLRTRAPLYRGRSPFSHDLHVLSPPLTFALSQDQTLQLKLLSISRQRHDRPKGRPSCPWRPLRRPVLSNSRSSWELERWDPYVTYSRIRFSFQGPSAVPVCWGWREQRHPHATSAGHLP